MNGLDIAILGVFSMSTLIGALRGFTKELLSLFNWGGAIVLSYTFLPVGQEFVRSYIANPLMASGAAFGVLFIIFLVILSIIAHIIAGYIRDSSFRGVDHSLGFGFGILRGIVIISAAELIFSTFSPRYAQSPMIQSARFIPMVRKGGDTLLQLLPASLYTTVLEHAKKAENQARIKIHEQLKDMAEAGLSAESLSQNFPQGGVPLAHSSPTIIQGLPPSSPPPASYPSGPDPTYSQVVPSSQGGQPVPSQMVVIRPGQPGQVPQLATASDQVPAMVDRMNQGNSTPVSMVPGLGQSNMIQDPQTTVEGLARLKPQSSPKEDSGYTRSQRDDMNRLFQAANGE